MRRIRRLCFAIIIMAFSCACVTAELGHLNMTLNLLEERLTEDLKIERKRIDKLDSTVRQLQEQKLTTSQTGVFRPDFEALQNIIEQLRKDVDNANYQNQIAKNDNIRLQSEINDLRHDIIANKKAFSKEKQKGKQMANEVHDLRSKQVQDLQLYLRQASDRQVNELMLFKSSTEKSLTSLRSDLHQMETKQNDFYSSTAAAKQQMNAYVEGVLNEACPLNPRFVDACLLQGISKFTCCLRGALRSLQEKLRANDLKLSEFEKKQNLRVSFSARVTPSIQDINPDETILFSDVINNEGSAYNATNGKFVAPFGGTYVFFSHILGDSRALETALMINENVKLLLYSGDQRYYAPGSNMLVIDMNKGDTARMVKHSHYGGRPFYIHHLWSTFSGFLLNVR